jgi:hypothetical protein
MKKELFERGIILYETLSHMFSTGIKISLGFFGIVTGARRKRIGLKGHSR